MCQLIRMEIYKASHNKWFFITLLFGVFLAISSGIEVLIFSHSEINLGRMEGYNPMMEIEGILNHWIGGEGISVSSSLFYFLFPLLAVLPYSWSYQYERKRGYIQQVWMRSSRWKYLASKYISVFLSGGVTVFIPLFVNIAFIALFFPAVQPDVNYIAYYGIFRGAMFAEQFYTAPVLFVCIYLLISFIFSGLIAVLSLSLSCFINNRIALTLIPFVFLLLLHSSMGFFEGAIAAGASIPEYSPIAFLKPRPLRAIPVFSVLVFEAVFLLMIALVSFIHIGRQKDVL